MNCHSPYKMSIEHIMFRYYRNQLKITVNSINNKANEQVKGKFTTKSLILM